MLNPHVTASDAQRAVWQVTDADRTITIPVGGASGAYDVDWGDDNSNSSVTGDILHTYNSTDNYAVRISVDFKRIFLSGD